MFGASAARKKERWYSRILSALTSPVGAKARPARGGDGGGALGGLDGLRGSAPGMLMTLLTRIFLPIAAIGGEWEFGKRIGNKINDRLNESGLLAKVFDAFDAIADGLSSAWSSVKSGYETVVGGIEGAWQTITSGFKSAFDAFIAFPNKIGKFFSPGWTKPCES